MRQWITMIALALLLVLVGNSAWQYRKEVRELQELNLLQQGRYQTLQQAVLQYNKEALDASKELAAGVQASSAEDQEILSSPLPSSVRDSLCRYATCK